VQRYRCTQLVLRPRADKHAAAQEQKLACDGVADAGAAARHDGALPLKSSAAKAVAKAAITGSISGRVRNSRDQERPPLSAR
jgi:hypothetical protein